MKNLTILSMALVMAFAFSGPVIFTAAPANAGDWYNCSGVAADYGDCYNPEDDPYRRR
ncbi:MAG: hypothetical protein V6Z81_05015 [Parvularculales bacterium]